MHAHNRQPRTCMLHRYDYPSIVLLLCFRCCISCFFSNMSSPFPAPAASSSRRQAAYANCECGYGPVNESDGADVNSKRIKWMKFDACPSRTALTDHVTFPSFHDLTVLNEPSMVYYASKTQPKRHWCFIRHRTFHETCR